MASERPALPRRRRARAGLQRDILSGLSLPGGARRHGPASRNVALATPIGYAFCSSGNFPTTHTMRHPILSDLVRIHPGFQSTRSIVLHRFGVDPAYSRWRDAFEITSTTRVW